MHSLDIAISWCLVSVYLTLLILLVLLRPQSPLLIGTYPTFLCSNRLFALTTWTIGATLIRSRLIRKTRMRFLCLHGRGCNNKVRLVT